jgi:hypothetical protein
MIAGGQGKTVSTDTVTPLTFPCLRCILKAFTGNLKAIARGVERSRLLALKRDQIV